MSSESQSEIQRGVGRPGFLFNPRVAGLLLLLLAGVCTSVILVDHFSPRDRQAAAGRVGGVEGEHRRDADTTLKGVSR